jgi:type IV pilus assembly protein PilM
MDNPFKHLFSKVLTSSPKSKSVIGIDIGASAIKVVQLKQKGGRAILETYGTLALGPYNQGGVGQVETLSVEQTVQALNDLMREAGVTVRDGAAGIPSASSLVFTMEFPGKINEKDFPSIVPTEARKYIPVPISEVLLDYFVIPKTQDSMFDHKSEIVQAAEKTEVLGVAIHNETVTRFKDILQKAEIVNPAFELETFSAIRSSIKRDLTNILFLDFGASRTKLSIIEYGIVRSFHVVNRGSSDITRAISQSMQIDFVQAEELKRTYGLLDNAPDFNVREVAELSVNYILSETSTVILNYEKKYNKTINKIILSGGGALLKGFYERAQQHFSSSVERSDPFAKADAPAFLRDVLTTIGPEFSVSLGLALLKLQAE